MEIYVLGTNKGHKKGNGWSWVINQMKIEVFERTQDQLRHKWDWMQK